MSSRETIVRVLHPSKAWLNNPISLAVVVMGLFIVLVLGGIATERYTSIDTAKVLLLPTAIAAVATAAFALQQVRVTQRATDLQLRPYLAAEEPGFHGDMAIINLVNHGGGAALNIDWRACADFVRPGMTMDKQPGRMDRRDFDDFQSSAAFKNLAGFTNAIGVGDAQLGIIADWDDLSAAAGRTIVLLFLLEYESIRGEHQITVSGMVGLAVPSKKPDGASFPRIRNQRQRP